MFSWPVMLMLVFTMVLDAPWGRAFQNWHPSTESIGNFYFSSITAATGISNVPFSIFELASISTVVWLLFANRQKRLEMMNDPAAMACLLSFPLLIGIGIITGALQGNDVSTMFTQTRSLVSLPLWFVIGYICFDTCQRQWQLYGIFCASMLFKALQGLYYHYIIQGGARGERQFLIEHVTSTFLTVSGFALLGWVALGGEERVRRAIIATPVLAIYSLAFLLNDRRAALIGLGLSCTVLLMTLTRSVFRRFLPMVGVAALVLGLFLTLTWQSRNTSGFLARTIKSLMDPGESSAGYRKVEDANLLLAVASEPLMGLGFGRRFPIIYELPDISGIYSEFDLVPHNTLLFVWTFAGPSGVACLAVFVALSIAAGGHLWKRDIMTSSGLLGALGIVVTVSGLVYIYADIGLREVRLMAEMGVVSGGLLALHKERGELS